MAVKTTGNGQQGETTREQIREAQDRFVQVQERYQQQVEQQAEEAKRELQQANMLGREAIGQYVRAIASGYRAFIPPAVVDPGPAIDFASDFVVRTAELQRSFLHELVSVGQLNARAVTLAAEPVGDR